MNKISKKHTLGWLPDLPDFRDYTPEQNVVTQRLKNLGQKDSIKSMLEKVKVTASVSIPPRVGLRDFCSPIEDQGSLGSCTAQAGAGLVEYFEKRAFGKYLNASRLFLYKTTRNLLGWSGDTGAYLRTTMAAMALFGIPPEEYWPYLTDPLIFDEEPTAFCYSFAQNYQAISYHRLDPPNTTREVLLNRIKKNLAAGVPSMFGFTVYSCITQAESSGEIPFPTPWERIWGGHAVVAIGYDDSKEIENTNLGGEKTTGAFLIRNSWGTDWGDQGYGWLPYKYITEWLAIDWWVLLKNEWIDTGNFGL